MAPVFLDKKPSAAAQDIWILLPSKSHTRDQKVLLKSFKEEVNYLFKPYLPASSFLDTDAGITHNMKQLLSKMSTEYSELH